jgi:hypothetical protein
MTFRSAAACVALLLLPMTALAQPLLIEGADSRREVDCGGRDVEITGFGHRVTLTGQCGTVSLMGSNQIVTLASATRLVVTGAENSAKASGTLGGLLVEGQGHNVTGSLPGNTEKPATVEVTGEGSVLDLELNGPTRIVVAGARHKVLWSAAPGLPAPQRDIRGIGNVVERAPRS